jgi:hypothetical protein
MLSPPACVAQATSIEMRKWKAGEHGDADAERAAASYIAADKIVVRGRQMSTVS